MISPQTREHSKAFVEEKGLSMELLSDPKNKVASEYGLVFQFPEDLKKVYLQLGIDLEKYNNDGSWRLSMPARYIIGRDGRIQYFQVSPDYTVRPDPSHTVDALRKMMS
jgi:peroxiredoxin